MTVKPDAEAALLDRVARGDEEAFRQLYREHCNAAYAAAFRLCGGNRADAEDAVQEAWLRAVRGLSSFRRASTFRTWLIGITIRAALEIGRGRLAWTERDELAGPPPDFDTALDLERLITDLPTGYRTVLLLHDLHGHTHEEIAALLEIESGTSKSQLSRARKVVRRWFSGAAREDKT